MRTKKKKKKKSIYKNKKTHPTLMAISSVPKPSNLARGIIASMHVVKIAASWLGVAKWRIQEIGMKMSSTLSPVILKKLAKCFFFLSFFLEMGGDVDQHEDLRIASKDCL
jgi:hypothetical protein